MRLLVFFFISFSVFTYGQSERSILYKQATEYGYRNQFKESERILSKIIELNPKDSMAYFDRAIMRENLGDTMGAIADFTQQISIDSKNADSYFLRGILHQKTKHFKLALSDFHEVNRLDRGNADAYFFAAQMYSQLQKSNRLITKQLKVCLNTNPQHEEAIKMRNTLN
jgi:tetratricopeptide (TPR) repeat protein